MRKTAIILIINMFSIVISSIGMKGSLTLNKHLIIIHGLLITSIIGAILLYTLAELIFGKFNE